MPDDGPVPHLFYCIRSTEDASGLEQLQQAAQEGRIVLHVHESAQGNRLRSQDLAKVMTQDGSRSAHVVMCGPDGLVKSMRAAMRTLGVLGPRFAGR
jgi:predicted ferric reductase